MKQRIRSVLSINADGGQRYRFINAIRQSDIICMAQYCHGETFFCEIYSSDLPKLQSLADSCGVTIHWKEHASLLSRMRRYRLRLGIPVGLLLCAGVLFYFSNTIAVIEIRGNETVPDTAILSVLEQNGIAEGTWIGGIDFPDSERKLRAMLPELAWTAIRSSGNRLVVEVSEATPHIPMLSERTPCNIISRFDAQITNVRVYAGHLERVIGDGVAKGELLVSGVFEDDKGHVTYQHSIASVTGIYTQEAELSEYFTISDTEPTGRVHQRRFFRLFSLKIPMGSGNHGFSECTVSESDTPFSFLQHTLPFGIVHETFTETETFQIIRTEEETRLALNAAIVRYEKNFLSDVTILDREIAYSSDDNGITCHLRYTLEGEIGTESDFFIK